MNGCRTPRTEARMASLLYIWNISFKSISDKKKKETMNRMKVQETPRTEARMASLLYIWNISFKYFVESHVLIHFF